MDLPSIRRAPWEQLQRRGEDTHALPPQHRQEALPALTGGTMEPPKLWSCAIAAGPLQPAPSMRHYQAIIFDMDGVIVDSEPLHERAFLEVFAEMGYGGTHGIQFADYYGRSDKAVWLDFIAKHHPPQPIEDLLAWKQRRLVELVVAERPIFEGLPELVGKLEFRYKLGVASGSPHVVIDEVLRLENLRRFFPVVVSTADVGQGKPAPDVFLRTAELLAVAPKECCVIEDAAVGIEAALAAGMGVIAITNTLPAEKLSRASHIVKHYAEIQALLL